MKWIISVVTAFVIGMGFTGLSGVAVAAGNPCAGYGASVVYFRIDTIVGCGAFNGCKNEQGKTSPCNLGGYCARDTMSWQKVSIKGLPDSSVLKGAVTLSDLGLKSWSDVPICYKTRNAGKSGLALGVPYYETVYFDASGDENKVWSPKQPY